MHKWDISKIEKESNYPLKQQNENKVLIYIL